MYPPEATMAKRQRHAETHGTQLEDGDPGFDETKYSFWYEDPNYRPYVINKAEAAETFGVSLPTIDAWIRKGAPVLRKGTNGVDYEICAPAFGEWVAAFRAGISISEYRFQQEKWFEKLHEKYRVLELQGQNERLSERMATLEREIAGLK